MKKRFLDLAVAGAVLGVVQSLVETLAFAYLYRDLLLAPYRVLMGRIMPLPAATPAG